MAGIAGVGAAAELVTSTGPAVAHSSDPAPPAAGAPSDASILNSALKLEYLEAEFSLQSATGDGLPMDLTTGARERGEVSGGRAVPFPTAAIQRIAQEIAADEHQHVAFLRSALGSAAVSRPAISLDASSTAAAMAAGLITEGQTFDPYADELNLLFAAFIFDDVGVTAYTGAAPFIANKTYLSAAAGILAVEASTRGSHPDDHVGRRHPNPHRVRERAEDLRCPRQSRRSLRR